jgi:hypothetical protein
LWKELTAVTINLTIKKIAAVQQFQRGLHQTGKNHCGSNQRTPLQNFLYDSLVLALSARSPLECRAEKRRKAHAVLNLGAPPDVTLP